MCIEIATYDVDDATKNYEKIIDLGLLQRVSYDRGAAYIKLFLSIICKMQPIKEEN